MGVWKHVVTYQGYPCKGVSWRQSPGLEPEYGYVDIDYVHLKKLSLEARAIPWRSISGAEWPSPLTIDVWKKNRATVTTPPEQTAPPGGGLAMFGDLVMTSFLDGRSMGEVRYRDVYVAPDGIEEIGRPHAARRGHKVGVVRVRITDIRAYFEDNGCFLGAINLRLPSGEWDPNTIRNGTTVWDAGDVFSFLAAMLPGSPVIDHRCDLYREKLAAEIPADVVSQGISTKRILAQLLDRYGLQWCPLPDGQVMINRAVSKRVPYGKIPTAPNSFGKEVEHVRDERKTVTVSRRPSAVLVVGKPIVKRVSAGFVPVVLDPDDGRIYRLEDIAEKWEYPLEKIKKEVFAGARNFRDVPPKGRRLGYKRAAALREWAYRGYAPAGLFGESGQPLMDGSEERRPFLPMRDAPWWVEELEKIGVDPIRLTRGEKWVLHDPIVLGSRFGQGLYTDYEQLEEVFKARSEWREIGEKITQSELDEVTKQINLKFETLIAASSRFESWVDEAKKKGLGASSLIIAAFKDMSEFAFNKMGFVPIQANEAEAQMAQLSFDLKTQIQALTKKAEALARQLKEDGDVVRENERHWEQHKDTFRAMGGVQVWHNLPHGIIESGYSINRTTGVIRFSEPVCRVKQSFLLEPEGAEIEADGSVQAIWGYELPANNPLHFTTALYVAEDGAPEDAVSVGPPSVVCAGVNRSSAIKPKVELEPKMRLYENELGEPFNVTEVITAGYQRAEGACGVIRAAEGYSYELQYFQVAVLESGVSSVQYAWSMKEKCSTAFMVNAPGASGPGGPGKLNRRTDINDARRDEDGSRSGAE